MLLLERHNRRAFARSTAGPVLEDEPARNGNDDGGRDVQAAVEMNGLQNEESENTEEVDQSMDDQYNRESEDESDSCFELSPGKPGSWPVLFPPPLASFRKIRDHTPSFKSNKRTVKVNTGGVMGTPTAQGYLQ